jgi:peptide/nickel transport system permease protein
MNFFLAHKFPILLVFSILPGLFLYSPPIDSELDSSLILPFTQFQHPLGTDKLGRDVYSLYTYGLLVTILVAIPARIFTILISLIVSLLSMYLPRYLKIWVDSISSVFLSIPSILVALISIYIFGTEFWVFLLAIALSDWAQSYESLQGKIRDIQESGYVLVSQCMGASKMYIFRKHILPELKNITYNLFLTGIPAVIMTIAIFSYLGIDFGADLFGPGLGEQISFSRDYAHVAITPMFVPILGIILLVLSVQKRDIGKK